MNMTETNMSEPKMSETMFKELVEDIIIQIEDAIEELDSDIDYESSDGILTIIMENKSQIIINRQTAALQLWLAAKSGGYHFDYAGKNVGNNVGNNIEKSDWQDDRSGEAFLDTLNRCLTEQSGEKIELDLE